MKNMWKVGIGVILGIALATGIKQSYAETQNLDSHGYGDSTGATNGSFVFRNSTDGGFQFRQIATSSSASAGIFGSTTTQKFGGVVYSTGSIFMMVDSVNTYLGICISTGGGTGDNLIWLSSITVRSGTANGAGSVDCAGNRN